MEVVKHEVRLSSENALDILSGYDVVVDGTDNFPTRVSGERCVRVGWDTERLRVRFSLGGDRYPSSRQKVDRVIAACFANLPRRGSCLIAPKVASSVSFRASSDRCRRWRRSSSSSERDSLWLAAS